jgi:hypothetical protein
MYPLLAFCPLSENNAGHHRLRHNHGACSTSSTKTDCLRLSLPSTHSGVGSPLGQGLPRPVRSAFRVSYPLSGFLLPKPLNLLSGPSVPGIRPSEFFSLQRSVPLSRPFALLPFPDGAQFVLQPASYDFRALFPLKSRSLAYGFYANARVFTLLGFSISGAFSLLTLRLLRAASSSVLSRSNTNGGATVL